MLVTPVIEAANWRYDMEDQFDPYYDETTDAYLNSAEVGEACDLPGR